MLDPCCVKSAGRAAEVRATACSQRGKFHGTVGSLPFAAIASAESESGAPALFKSESSRRQTSASLGSADAAGRAAVTAGAALVATFTAASVVAAALAASALSAAGAALGAAAVEEEAPGLMAFGFLGGAALAPSAGRFGLAAPPLGEGTGPAREALRPRFAPWRALAAASPIPPPLAGLPSCEAQYWWGQLVKQSTGHTHTGHTDRENTPDTGTHTRTTRKKIQVGGGLTCEEQ